jgi:hypothetical protein
MSMVSTSAPSTMCRVEAATWFSDSWYASLRGFTATCPRKVFVERFPDFVRPWARVSNRLLEELKAMGLSASAEVSERLAPRLGMQVKAPTLLRYLRAIPSPSDTPVRV